MSQFGVLEALHHIGPLCQKDIGQKLLRSSGNITMVIDNLEKRGLVRRERNPKDRRFFVVHLAEEGRQIIGDLFPRHTKVIAGEMSALTEDEQKTLATLCKKLGLKNKNE
jgi:MarR family 2-MHQ and catechol resistance regulon transcriptional repressor